MDSNADIARELLGGDDSPEYVVPRKTEPPEIEIQPDGSLMLTWDSGVVATLRDLERGKRDTTCVLQFSSTLYQRKVAPKRINLLSESAVRPAVSRLSKIMEGHDWEQIFDHLGIVADDYVDRPNEPIKIGYTKDIPESIALVSPLIYDNEIVFVFGNGGTGKSTLMTALAVAAISGMPAIPGFHAPEPIDVLYIDYERGEMALRQRVSKILRGAAWEQAGFEIDYMTARGSLMQMADYVRRYCDQKHIGLIIVDSVAAACGSDAEKQETVTAYDNALRLINRPSIHIAHETKETKGDYPFGSVFWHNLARSTWRVVKTSEENSPDIKIGLFNKKANNRPFHRPIGLEIRHRQDTITFHTMDVLDEPALAASASIASQIRSMLKRGQKMTVGEIAEELSFSEQVVRNKLNQYRDKWFGNEKFAGKNVWFLLAKTND